jgi:hypothetical protein
MHLIHVFQLDVVDVETKGLVQVALGREVSVELSHWECVSSAIIYYHHDGCVGAPNAKEEVEYWSSPPSVSPRG